MKRCFTLVEVVVALAILTAGLGGFLSMAFNAQNRMAKARRQWLDFHMLEQAVEYHLLQTGLEPEPPPVEVFDYPGYRTECYYNDDLEEIPDDFQDAGVAYPLRRWTISVLRTSDRQPVATVNIDRIDYVNTQ